MAVVSEVMRHGLRMPQRRAPRRLSLSWPSLLVAVGTRDHVGSARSAVVSAAVATTPRSRAEVPYWLLIGCSASLGIDWRELRGSAAVLWCHGVALWAVVSSGFTW